MTPIKNLCLELSLTKISFGLISLIGSGFMLACNSQGTISASPPPPAVILPQVLIPTIALPDKSPYYSNKDEVVIVGMCMTGNKVQIAGDESASTTCLNSQFHFTVQKKVDGVYSFLITQTNDGASSSDPVFQVWIRKTSIAPPLITSPAQVPFKSAQSKITISGNCETGAYIALSGDGMGSAICNLSKFTLDLPKFVDGDYNITLTQTDLAGNNASTSLIWQKRALTVSPSKPTLVVKSQQVFSISGGSEVYEVHLKTNASGALYDSTTKTYTGGTLANKTDILTITDSLGSTADISIGTVADAADHFALPIPNQNPATEIVGKVPTKKIQVKVVDRYGNGIAFYPVLFQMILGDAPIVSSPLQVTDLSGVAEVAIQMGYSSLLDTLYVSPLSGILPDLANSTKPTIQVSINAVAKGQGKGNIGSSFLVGTSPISMVTADFNGDSILDMAVLSQGDPNLVILKGIGNSLFNPMSKVGPICTGPAAIQSGDLNGDGKVDLVIVCRGSDMVSVLLGNGDGTFQPAKNFATGANETQPCALAIADVNGDGKQDLVLVAAGGSVAAIRFGLGNGNFGDPTEINTDTSPSDLLLVDIDKDGYKDLVVINSFSNTLFLYLNNGNGTFKAPTILDTGNNPIAIKTADFNGDTYPDIAVVNYNSSDVSIFLNDKSGGLNPTGNIPVGVNPMSLDVLDINGDKIIDIVTANNVDNSISVLYGSGTGTFISQGDVPVISSPVFITSRDVNGDATQDLLIVGAGAQQVQVLPVQKDGTLGFSTPVGTNPSAMISLDLDGDGKLDLAVANYTANSVTLLKGDGKGFFSPYKTLTTGAGPTSLIAKDLLHTGKLDLLVVNKTSGTFQVFLNDGIGGFKDPLLKSTGSSPTSLVSADFNHDGVEDVAVSVSGSGKVAVFLGVGDGTFDNPINYIVGSGPTQILVGDFNRDNILDLITVNSSGGSVSFLGGNGDGTFRSHLDYLCANGSESAVAVDFNGDGLLDLAISNSNDAKISFLLGGGDGSFADPTFFDVTSNTNSINAGDFDGDGKMDLAVSRGNDKKITILYGSGDGNFNNSSVLDTKANTGKIQTMDVNGDGYLDILSLDLDHNQISVWLGH